MGLYARRVLLVVIVLMVKSTLEAKPEEDLVAPGSPGIGR